MIMCVSPSYEYDKLCQFEAELAIRLGKPYIVVNVQAKYEPDYWLENIVENRNVVSFGLATCKHDITLIIDEIDSIARGVVPARQKQEQHPRRVTTASIFSSSSSRFAAAQTPARAKSAAQPPNRSSTSTKHAAPPEQASSSVCTVL